MISPYTISATEILLSILIFLGIACSIYSNYILFKHIKYLYKVLNTFRTQMKEFSEHQVRHNRSESTRIENVLNALNLKKGDI